MTENRDVFELYAAYYNALYRNKKYEHEVEYILEILKSRGITAGKIVELGTGTGKHAELISRRGFTVHGIELSQAMIDQCETSETFSVTQGDIRNTLVGRNFDAAIAMFHVMSYLTSNQDLIAALSNIRGQLKQGAIFLFDVWYTPAVLAIQPETRILRMEDSGNRFTRIAEPVQDTAKNVVTVNYTIIGGASDDSLNFEFFEKHEMRHFSGPEIELAATLAGFKLAFQYEFLTKDEPSQSSWGVLFGLEAM